MQLKLWIKENVSQIQSYRSSIKNNNNIMWAPAAGCEKTVVWVSYVCKISSYFDVHANSSRFSITAEVTKSHYSNKSIR